MIVTGEVPVDAKVTEYFAAVFTTTSPNEMLDKLGLRVDVAGFNCRATFFDTPPAAAIRFTVCEIWVDDTAVVNATLVAFVGIVTVAGIYTAALLLDKATLTPPFGAGPLKLTVHGSVAAPVMETALQEIPLSTVLLWARLESALATPVKTARSNIGVNHELRRPPRALLFFQFRPARLLWL